MKSISLGILLGTGLAVLAMNACTSGGDSDDAKGTGGGAATGGNGSGATGSGTGGNGSGTGGLGGGQGGDPDAVACPAATEAALLDFGPGMGGAPSTTDSTFGDFTNTFSGGTFIYGGPSLTSDVTGENWNISGDVDTWSGFGLYFADCGKVDASAFKGITFKISGDADGKPVTLWVGTAANTAPNADEPDFGRCTAASCANGEYQVNVTSSSETIEVLWADLTGGAPEATVNPAEIVGFGWYFTPPAGVDTPTVTPYPVDIVVDDIGFIP